MGMDSEGTGYENILLRGLYLGMSKAEILSKMDEIAEFSDLGDFLTVPIRTYSDGMHARLAFSISTCFQPDILLLDEGIGAGDAAFMEKAQRRLEGFVSQAGILVLASHSDTLVRSMCNKALLMEQGKALAFGEIDDVISQYQESIKG
ncbi:MAG: hypothetical protein O7G83_22770 [Proteobacteria bacterium]|nr:hypothetical protein [Pseudomonadota bacterium]